MDVDDTIDYLLNVKAGDEKHEARLMNALGETLANITQRVGALERSLDFKRNGRMVWWR